MRATFASSRLNFRRRCQSQKMLLIFAFSSVVTAQPAATYSSECTQAMTACSSQSLTCEQSAGTNASANCACASAFAGCLNLAVTDYACSLTGMTAWPVLSSSAFCSLVQQYGCELFFDGCHITGAPPPPATSQTANAATCQAVCSQQYATCTQSAGAGSGPTCACLSSFATCNVQASASSACAQTTALWNDSAFCSGVQGLKCTPLNKYCSAAARNSAFLALLAIAFFALVR